MKAPFAIALLELGACASTLADRTVVAKGGTAGLGQSTRVGALTVTPEALIEDSRCPADVQCVWAGRLVLRARIEGRGWRETADLTLGRAYVTRGTRLTLIRVEPERTSQSPPSQSSYRFAFLQATEAQ